MTATMGLFVQNPYGSVGQGTVTGFGNNLSYEPTIEELNRTISSSRDAATIFFAQRPADEQIEPAFGNHIREATATVKKLFSPR